MLISPEKSKINRQENKYIKNENNNLCQKKKKAQLMFLCDHKYFFFQQHSAALQTTRKKLGSMSLLLRWGCFLFDCDFVSRLSFKATIFQCYICFMSFDYKSLPFSKAYFKIFLIPAVKHLHSQKQKEKVKHSVVYGK